MTTQAVSYTNHTLMPEALETWPVRMFEELLPRHLEIVYEINRRFLDEVGARFPGDSGLIARMSLIDENGERRVRMASLAIVASHKVNGVSALHSRLMVQTIFADFAAMWPQRFLNVTNGVTPRRWLMQANPELCELLDRHIGTDWRAEPRRPEGAGAPRRPTRRSARSSSQTKRANKERLAERVRRDFGVTISPDSLFDVQIKRIHEYKRQLLNVLHVVARYQAIVANPDADWVPRTVIFAGKAASAYHAAKLTIQLIHDVARVVNADPRVGNKLKVVFLPNYSVSLAEVILPAADLSEQISTAGTEASGTGNMKFALNGALTIGTWDGANIEMAEAMGVREHVRVRPAHRCRREDEELGIRSASLCGRKPIPPTGPRRHRRRRVLLGRARSLPVARAAAAAPRPVHAARRLRRLRARAGAGRRAVSPARRPGPSARCATSPAWARSAPIARSPSTSNTCGRIPRRAESMPAPVSRQHASCGRRAGPRPSKPAASPRGSGRRTRRTRGSHGCRHAVR